MPKSKYEFEEDIEMMLGEHADDEYGFPDEDDLMIGFNVTKKNDPFDRENWLW